jgi:hypothetical protein
MSTLKYVSHLLIAAAALVLAAAASSADANLALLCKGCQASQSASTDQLPRAA